MKRTGLALITITLLMSLTPVLQASDEGIVEALWAGGTTATSPNETAIERSKNPAVPNRMLSGQVNPVLVFFLPAPDKNKHLAVLVCPGGAYRGLAWDNEGMSVAQYLGENGFVGVALKYRRPKPEEMRDGQPIPLIDARHAIRVIRSRAAELGVDPDKIGIAGFSAGGHLAASVGAYGPEKNTSSDPLAATVSGRADFMVLGYPVISADPEVVHEPSFKNLLGANPDPAMVERFSMEKHASLMPPAFIVHAKDDPIKVANSERLVAALQKAGVPVEFHFYETGWHGFGLARNKPAPLRDWPQLLVKWLDDLASTPGSAARQTSYLSPTAQP